MSLVGALSGVLLSGIGFALIKRRKPFLSAPGAKEDKKVLTAVPSGDII